MNRNVRLSKTTRFSKTRLSNGLAVLYLYTARDPISACHFLIPGGSNQETDRDAGIGTLMWSLLMKGTKLRSARRISEDIESIGASIGAGAGHDFSEVSCHAISENFLPALRILSDVLLNPAYPAQEVEKEKEALIAAIHSKKENIFTVAHETLARRLFEGHPYGRPTSGYEETIKKIESRDLFAWHQKTVLPHKSILAVASNLPLDQLRPELEKLFGNRAWKKKPIALKKINSLEPLKKDSYVPLEKPFEQAYLMMGYLAPSVTSPDYAALKILNACLGGGMSARLFQALREQQGLAYDVGSMYPSRKNGSSLVIYMGLQASKLEDAKKGIRQQLDEIRNKKLTKTELREIKNYLKGTYILDHQTNSQRAHYLGWWDMVGKDPLFDRQYLSHIDKVTVDQVLRVAKKYFGKPAVTVEIHPQKKSIVPSAVAP